MRTYVECIPCFLEQAIRVSKLIGINALAQKDIIDDICRMLPSISMDTTPPEIAAHVYDIVEKHTGIQDPYEGLKEESNAKALSMYHTLKMIVMEAEKRDNGGARASLLAAVECAIAGNIIDYGAVSDLDIENGLQAILRREEESIASESDELFSFALFAKRVERAGSILYIGDNSGEIVFDRILLETIREEFGIGSLFFAVRDRPIINDVTEEDAYRTGIDAVAEVISSGSRLPGTFLPRCNTRFQSLFDTSDVVISKGQGNYESLSGTFDREGVFFLLRAKCDVVARHLNCGVGDIILHGR